MITDYFTSSISRSNRGTLERKTSSDTNPGPRLLAEAGPLTASRAQTVPLSPSRVALPPSPPDEENKVPDSPTIDFNPINQPQISNFFPSIIKPRRLGSNASNSSASNPQTPAQEAVRSSPPATGNELPDVLEETSTALPPFSRRFVRSGDLLNRSSHSFPLQRPQLAPLPNLLNDSASDFVPRFVSSSSSLPLPPDELEDMANVSEQEDELSNVLAALRIRHRTETSPEAPAPKRVRNVPFEVEPLPEINFETLSVQTPEASPDLSPPAEQKGKRSRPFTRRLDPHASKKTRRRKNFDVNSD